MTKTLVIKSTENQEVDGISISNSNPATITDERIIRRLGYDPIVEQKINDEDITLNDGLNDLSKSAAINFIKGKNEKIFTSYADLPPNPKDKEQIVVDFNGHKGIYYWDETREKWLSEETYKPIFFLAWNFFFYGGPPIYQTYLPVGYPIEKDATIIGMKGSLAYANINADTTVTFQYGVIGTNNSTAWKLGVEDMLSINTLNDGHMKKDLTKNCDLNAGIRLKARRTWSGAKQFFNNPFFELIIRWRLAG